MQRSTDTPRTADSVSSQASTGRRRRDRRRAGRSAHDNRPDASAAEHAAEDQRGADRHAQAVTPPASERATARRLFQEEEGDDPLTAVKTMLNNPPAGLAGG